MSDLNDLKFKALGDQGYTGSIGDRYLQWLQGNGATSDSIPDAEREVLAAQGVWVDPTRSLNDAWFLLLGNLGYTGSLNDRWLAFWDAGGTITPPPPATNHTMVAADSGGGFPLVGWSSPSLGSFTPNNPAVGTAVTRLYTNNTNPNEIYFESDPGGTGFSSVELTGVFRDNVNRTVTLERVNAREPGGQVANGGRRWRWDALTDSERFKDTESYAVVISY